MDDVKERLTREEAGAATLMAIEHRHRYGLAASLLGGLRVVDLCCGSGYGAAMLAETARSVHGVDVDATAIADAASAADAEEVDNATFEVGDALRFLLQDDLAERFDAIVCFEGLEHLRELEPTLERLRTLAEAGMTMLLSVPNSRGLDEENPFHLTDFSWEEALDSIGSLPGATVLTQYLAEGSLVCGADSADAELESRAVLADRHEPEFANHYLVCVGVVPGDVDTTLQVVAAPVANRYMRSLERANNELRTANRRLARRRLGKADSSAGTLVAKYEAAVERIDRLEAEVERLRFERDDYARNREEWIERCMLAEERVIELDQVLASTRRELEPTLVRAAAKLGRRG